MRWAIASALPQATDTIKAWAVKFAGDLWQLLFISDLIRSEMIDKYA
jgi:hypothetical protein